VYSVYNDVFERIGDEKNDFSDLTIYELGDSLSIQRIEISRLDDETTIFDANPTDDDSDFTALSSELKLLRADRLDSDGYSETIEFAGATESWAYQMSVYTNADAAPFVMQVSELTGGPLLFGGLPEEDKLFRFEQGFIDAFHETVFERVKRDVPTNPFPEATSATEVNSAVEPAAN